MLQFSSPISSLPGASSRFLPKLKKLKIDTVGDLLLHFPYRYEDFSQLAKIKDLKPNQNFTVKGVIKRVDLRRARSRKMALTEITLSDETGTVKAIWFNQPYLKNTLKTGKVIYLSGKTAFYKQKIVFSNPAYELKTAQETKHTARLVPIYPETKGLTSRGLRFLIKSALEKTETEEFLPASILAKEKLPAISQALNSIHFPNKLTEAAKAKKRFAFEDLFLLQLANLKFKQKLRQSPAFQLKFNLSWFKQTLKELPFELTQNQKNALWEIIQDIQKPYPMNRLLQGDVGSGKTIVALLAALIAAQNGYQTAFMAPTEILAGQHYQTMIKTFPNFKQGIVLLTSKTTNIYYGQNLKSALTKAKAVQLIAAQKAAIVFGTHALIQKQIKFPKLALAIVDEQHRFGVRQRATLVRQTKLSGKVSPHFLSMSATPIPRTLSLTVFGDLDLSLITEPPRNRKPVVTEIIPPEERQRVYQFIESQIKAGRQAFVICPRIEPATASLLEAEGRLPIHLPEEELKKLEVKSVKEEFKKLKEKIFPKLKIAMLHGKMTAKEKNEVMEGFAKGKTDILVSTSVIEVGIDVPNAAIMVIESAERFGLAQLYQLRGRVGRGKHQSYCFLFADAHTARLKAILTAKSGFELAELDLKLRGPGEFFGESQTGMPDLAMTALQNPKLVIEAKKDAVWLLNQDPNLKDYPLLKNKLDRFQAKVHLE